MSNYTKDNLLAIAKESVPVGSLAIKIGSEVFPLTIGKSGGSADYYKCASVNTVNKTWSGYKAVLADSTYSFEEIVTTGLIYDITPPIIGEIYSNDMGVCVLSFPGKGIAVAKDANTLYAVSALQGVVDQVSGAELINNNTIIEPNCFDFSTGEAVLDLPITDDTKWELSDFTLEVCYTAARERTHSYPSMFTSAASWTTGAFCLRFDNTGNSKVGFFWTGQGDPVFYGDDTIVKDDTFRHLAVCRKDGVITMYDNGFPVATKSNATTMNIFVNSDYGKRIRLGALDTETAQYRGKIKWARISNVCRYSEKFDASTLKRDVVFSEKG
jgi:hypothetical protein